MNEKINITKMDGSNIQAELICGLENKNTNKRYIYYTLNEIVGAEPNSTVKIYVTKVKQDNPALDEAITEEDWGLLKGYMGDSLKGIVNPDIKYIPLSELSNPVSVSERAIAMPTNYDYIAKQKAMYLENAGESGARETLIQEQTPVQEPSVITEQELNASIEPVPTMEPTPAVETVQPLIEAASTIEQEVPSDSVAEAQPIPTPSETPAEINPISFTETQVEKSVAEEQPVNSVKLEPIDIASIEEKYAKMVDDINQLKEKEIEAAKRYNATLELNVMHIDQHANYIQKDLEENAVTAEPTTQEQAVASTNYTPVQEPVSTVSPSIEPTPVTPIIPEPVPANSQEIETNWFDMPANN